MSFPYRCTMCPMKFMTEADLQIHDQVHDGSRHSAYDFDSRTEPLFNEFLNAFFPNLNDSYIPAMNDFSVPDYRDPTTAEWEDTSSLPSSENEVTYTTLKNITIPYGSSEKIEPGSSNPVKQKEPIKSTKEESQSKPQANPISSSVILQKLPPNVRFVNNIHSTEVLQQGLFNNNFLKPVYITRRPHSIAMIQHRYGDDMISRYPQYHTSFLHPAMVAKCLPNLAKANIENKNVPVIVPLESKGFMDGIQFDGVAEENPKKSVAKKVSKRSRRSTTGEKPYMCEVCFKRFAFIKKFIAHKRIHIVGKLFSCFVCNKRFGYSYKLNQHMRLHAAEKECNLCKKTCKNMAHLRRHRCKGASRKISSKKRSYGCTECNRTFARVNYLNLHKRCHVDKQDSQIQMQEQFLPMVPLQNSLE